MNPLFHTEFSISDSLKNVRKSVLIYETIISHTGKTLLAQKLLEKYKYSVLSIDLLKMGLIRSKNTDLTPEDDEKLEFYLWKIVKEIVKTAVENKQNLIVEGCYIPFTWKQDFTEEYLKDILYQVWKNRKLL